MQAGRYKISVINSGLFRLDGGAMFGVIPKPLWEKNLPADKDNRIQLTTRNLLLQNGSKNILVDTGMGQKWDSKSEKIYVIDQVSSSMESELLKNGLKPGDITDVILTHLHFDHTGGSTKIENGKIIPAFPNARYYVQKKNFDWGMNPTERDRGSYLKDSFEPLAKEGLLHFWEGNTRFDDEIELLIINGHTFAQQLVKLSDSSGTIVYCGDLIPTVSHIHLPYIMGYDLQPLVTLQEKKEILARAVDENWKLLFEHDADTTLATVRYTEKGFTADEKFNSL
jgi:glyoxylase-like metal-dependent hydrolase (beta-lactamase superfamily II)